MNAITITNCSDQKLNKFEPQEYATLPHSDPLGSGWTTIYEHSCDFDAEGFFKVLHLLARNPSINSSVLFRADILYDSDGMEHIDAWQNFTPEDLKAECPRLILNVSSERLQRRIIRRFIPRNDGLDKPINQSIFLYRNIIEADVISNHVVMIPHVQNAQDIPFYHPRVAGLAFTHISGPDESKISISYCPYATEASQPFSNRQLRMAYHLLRTVWKHGQGNLAGYQKRMHHDQIISQKRVQDRFAMLKRKYATRLIDNWAEVTDPSKQVFEQIGIAAFLLELWIDMYSDKEFPGFVDIGCGNGILVEILLSEGYFGWGLEGHRRKTWPTLSPKTQKALVHGIIVPAPLDCLADPQHIAIDFGMSNNPLPDNIENTTSITKKLRSLSIRFFNESRSQDISSLPPFHNGLFNTSPETHEGPFLISNHADELTGWTPFLALLNRSSFFIVPCCSRNLSGERFRAPSHGNNWTADLSAPYYFHEQQTQRVKEHKKHISIHTPLEALNIKRNGHLDASQSSPTLSVSSTGSYEQTFLISKNDLDHKYHFVNAAPLALPPSAIVSTDQTQSAHQPSTNGQAAETGDLKKLSPKARSRTLSGYQALCCWVVHLADKCGYLVEREMLRLPSTRNFGIVGRFMKGDLQLQEEDENEVLDKNSTLRERMDHVLTLIKAEGGAQRSKWVSVCEKEIVKGNDTVEHCI